MAKVKPISGAINLLVWITGVLVSLVVGLGMVDGILTAEKLLIPPVVTVWAGWIVVVLTIVSAIMAIIHKLQ